MTEKTDEQLLDDLLVEIGSTVSRGGYANHYSDKRKALSERMRLMRIGRDSRDSAYHERNQVVAALAKCFPSGLRKTNIEGWEPEWHNCVYIDLPTGQVSWHYHDDDKDLFSGLPAYPGEWDGHDTETKYNRLRALQRYGAGFRRGENYVSLDQHPITDRRRKELEETEADLAEAEKLLTEARDGPLPYQGIRDFLKRHEI